MRAGRLVLRSPRRLGRPAPSCAPSGRRHILVLAGVLATGVVWAELASTPHDFSGKDWGTQESCKFCHIPHSAQDPQLAPLWNHASTTQTGWSLYGSPTLDAAPAEPSGVSLACLSCHDGTLAIDSYGSRTGSVILGDDAAGSYSNSAKVIGADLTDDHPVSVEYAAAGETGLHAVPQNDLPLYGHQADRVECASCHNPHDNRVHPFLRVSNSRSELCLSCHNK